MSNQQGSEINTIVARLDTIAAWAADDPEAAHGSADDILLEAVPVEVRAAYERIQAVVPWWGWA